MKPKILVVDDEHSIREFFEILLRKSGYGVTCAQGGAEAIQLLDQELFDLVVTDIAMDGVDGIEVLKYARQLDPEALVIMITAYASVETALEAMKDFGAGGSPRRKRARSS